MTRNVSRTGWLLALSAVVAAAACVAWRVRESARLVRDSEPFQALPAAATRSLLVIGDSTAVGTGAGSPARSLAGLVAAAYPQLRVVNHARDGAKYEHFSRQLQMAAGRFDVVLVLGGGNDVIRLTGNEKLRADVMNAARLARERGDHVILMPPGNVGNAPFFWPPLSWWMSRRARGLHEAIRDAAAASGATYVNLYQPRASDPFAQRPAELHARDGLHPSDAGYRLWLDELGRQSQLGEWVGASR